MIKQELFGAVFIDSQGWMALMNLKDQSHCDARHVYDQIIEKRLYLYTTNWTAYEALSHIREREKGGGLNAASKLQAILGMKNVVTVVTVTADLEERAVQRFWRYEDKPWSVVLCASHEVMTDLGLRYVLSANKGFAQAGFVNLI